MTCATHLYDFQALNEIIYSIFANENHLCRTHISTVLSEKNHEKIPLLAVAAEMFDENTDRKEPNQFLRIFSMSLITMIVDQKNFLKK